ncbi:phosphatase PAP2 family protein [Streptococcus halichoeri]|uniref:phosphatase PAP2 family protein n=1 Tax=Streptococcus halichoeri TaxID=254785 RepID=UPI001C8DEC93|nr:phosphatase PAP2 family protein [Streptococcus halichoeri]
MKNKQKHFLIASFAFLLFVMIGYAIRFYPATLTGYDQTIQAMVRGNLPDNMTRFFMLITVLGNVLTQLIVVVFAFVILQALKWKAESYYVLIAGLGASVLIISLKLIYQRVRPTIEHLVFAGGYSFPSGHSMGSMLIYGSLIVIAHQRIKQPFLRLVVQWLLGSLIVLIGLSRIYLGVHYPSDVLAGFILGFGVLELVYPFYDRKRFEWRFHGEQN